MAAAQTADPSAAQGAAQNTAPPAAAAPAEPGAIETLQGALSGDPVMLRDLLATVGAFCVRLLVAGLILAATLWAAERIARLARASIERVHKRNNEADRTLSDFVSALVRYVVIAIGAVAVLQQLGVEATSVLAVLGAASLAVGLALQGTLGNVAAGVMLLLLRPYRVGDRVELNGQSGKVAHLDLFHTRVLDYEGMTVHLPNGKVFGETIVNVSQSGRRRIDLEYGIDYDDDYDLALALLGEIAAAEPRVLQTPAPWTKVIGLGDSSVNVGLRCWSTPDDWLDTKMDLNKQIIETFQARGLSFPYPHQVEICRPKQYLAEEEAEATAEPSGSGSPAP